MPIIKDALANQRPLSGTELLKSEVLERLGIASQANIGIREQKIDGIPENKKPFPVGTYDTDNGRAGLTIMAVEPIISNGKLIGTTISGYLLNRNFEIVDRVKYKTGIPTATIFANDWRVSTNVPYTDQTTRALGTRVSREVAEAVLERGTYFIGEANIIGSNYRTAYHAIYDHTRQLIPSCAQM